MEVQEINKDLRIGIRIGIRFSDNDFYNTLQPFMKVLSQLEFIPTKKQIVILFDNLAYGLYLAYQNQFEYSNGEDNDKYLKDSYLNINENNIYFNEEVDKYCLDRNYWDNSEFHMLNYGQVSSI